MFTGIIREIGVVRSLSRQAQSGMLVVDLADMANEVAPGDSVSVDGCCLTATEAHESLATFDVSAETLRLTTLGGLHEGDRVNLEPALRVGDRLGGHFVSGHVDGLGTILQNNALPGEVRLEVEVSTDLADAMVMKGSVAVDGTSLTIAALRATAFEVSLVPYTLKMTTLQYRRPGDRVNIECDMIGRWVKRLLGSDDVRSDRNQLSMQDLEEQGF